jgi:hypothetical protein
MAEIIYRAASAIGIRPAVDVRETKPLHPEIFVTVNHKTVVCEDIDIRWLMDSELKQLKAVLTDMYQTAKKG